MPSSAAAALLLLLFLISRISGSGEGGFIYSGCSPSKFDPATPFAANLNALLAAMAAASSQTSYSALAAGNGTTPAPAYGLYQCRADLDLADCAACVRSAAAQLPLACPLALAASLQLDTCAVRYSADDFIGRADSAVEYRKCGPSAGGDVEFLKRRDDVVAGLRAGSAAYFRASSAGSVQGYAQCMGDLAAGDCVTCLGEAVGELERACGAALAGDVFLQQCYARFWSSGYYLRSSADYTDDDIGRTVAIIIGILAGLAIFVIFIAFLKRAC